MAKAKATGLHLTKQEQTEHEGTCPKCGTLWGFEGPGRFCMDCGTKLKGVKVTWRPK